MDPVKLIRKSYLCRELSEDELLAVVDIAVVKKYPKGKMIFFEGDPAEGFFVLLEGRVRIFKASPEGREYTLHNINPGQMFAEAAIFQGTRFPANGMAVENSITAFLPKKQFLGLIKASPQISLKMIAALAGFVRDFNLQVESLSLKEVSARLAVFLLRQREKTGMDEIHLVTSKTELARSLGTISATLSRNLRKLKELGIINTRRQTIIIKNLTRLEAIAEGREKI